MIGMMMTPIRSGTFDCPFQLRWSRGARAGWPRKLGWHDDCRTAAHPANSLKLAEAWRFRGREVCTASGRCRWGLAGMPG
jgi:hypothetical protein